MEKRGVVVGAGSVVLAAVVAFGGFANADAAVTAAPQTATVARHSTVAEPVAMTPASTYLIQMRGLLVGQTVHDQTDAELITSGREVCTSDIADGLTWAKLPALTEHWGLNLAFTRAYVAAAAVAFCPSALPGMG